VSLDVTKRPAGILRVIQAFVLIGAMAIPGLGIPVASATGETLTSGTPVTSTIGTATPITSVQVNGSGNANISVRLFVSHGTLAMTTETGLTFTGADTGATLQFSGLRSDINTGLATLEYTATSLGSDTLEASLIGPGEIYDPANGHIYEYVYAPSNGTIDWYDASTAASALTVDGLTGYLATVTSQAENDFIAARLPAAGWMGATDLAVKHNWEWVDGPEAGEEFYTGLGNAGGYAVNNMYTNWNNGEPNNSPPYGEDCAQFLSGSGNNGKWNDLSCDHALLPGYVVEFGAPGQTADISYSDTAINTVGPTVNVSTCAQLQNVDQTAANDYATINLTTNIDCTGYNFNPLFGGGFDGTFNGQGHDITNLTMDHSSSYPVALFASTQDATLENVTLASGSVSGEYYTGALVGEDQDSTITNVHSNLSVSSVYYSGGLIGDITTTAGGPGASVTDSSSAGNVTVSDGYSGGLIGYSENTDATLTIERDFTTGSLTTTGDDVGGIIGYVENTSNTAPASTIFENDYTRGNVDGTGQTSIAGLIGYMQAYDNGFLSSITLQNSYASGTMTGQNLTGGLVGDVASPGGSNSTYVLTNNFSAAPITVTDPTNSGALIGANQAGSALTSLNNYFDATAATISNCTSTNAITNCTPITAASDPTYFKDNNMNPPMNQWDFAAIWFKNAANYPTFAPLDPSDSDGDGITNAVENSAPNNGDANGDGIQDDTQSNVTSFVDPVTGKYVSMQISPRCNFTSVGGTSESADTVKDSGYTYPTGLLNFTASCASAGFTATVTEYYYGLGPAGYVARDYNPSSDAYVMIPGASITRVMVGGQEVTKLMYQITDGGPMDTDGSANGIIIDPSGLALSAVGVPNTGVYDPAQ
jgi:hypothetical protein